MTNGDDEQRLAAKQRARVLIDKQLVAAGWVVQDKKDLNLFAAQGVAVRESIMAPGHGRADYLLYVDKSAVKVIEAKPQGTPLSGVEWQSAMYAEGLPADVRLKALTVDGRLPFVFEVIVSAVLVNPRLIAAAAPVTRLALIGDIGGHLQQLQEALWSLGVDNRIPDDLIVIQVGDLVHKGPDSDAVVELVDGFLQDQPDRWVQLMGNHEACHLGADLFAHDQVSPQTEATLQRWYDDGLLRLGVAVSSDLGPILVTHARPDAYVVGANRSAHRALGCCRRT